MLARRPTDAAAYHQLQGRRVSAAPANAPSLWWRNSDLPAFVMHSPQGIDVGGGAFMMGGLAKEAAMLHIRALVVVHFFSGFRRDHDIHQIVEQHNLETCHTALCAVGRFMHAKTACRPRHTQVTSVVEATSEVWTARINRGRPTLRNVHGSKAE